MMFILEKWFIRSAVRNLAFVPERNSKAKHVFWAIFLTAPLNIVSIIKLHDVSVVICLILQLISLYVIYLWLKYNVANYNGWVAKKDDPFLYWLYIATMVCAYLLMVGLPFRLPMNT